MNVIVQSSKGMQNFICLMQSQGEQIMDKVQYLIGKTNASYLFNGLNVFGTLGVFILLQQLKIDYTMILIVQGAIQLLYLQYNTEINDEQSASDIKYRIIIAFLNVINDCSLYYSINNVNLVLLILIFNSKFLIFNALSTKNMLGIGLIVTGLFLIMLNNQLELHIWILIGGQCCKVASVLMNSKLNLITDIQFQQHLNGIMLIMFGITIRSVVTNNNMINIWLMGTIIIVPCIGMMLLNNLREKARMISLEDAAENLLYGGQIMLAFILNMYDTNRIGSVSSYFILIVVMFYEMGVTTFYLKKNILNSFRLSGVVEQ